MGKGWPGVGGCGETSGRPEVAPGQPLTGQSGADWGPEHWDAGCEPGGGREVEICCWL